MYRASLICALLFLLLPFVGFAASCSTAPVTCPVGSMTYGPQAGCPTDKFYYSCTSSAPAAPTRAASAPVTAPSQSVSALSIGARGEAVVELQRKLISLGLLASGNDTGYFGILTRAAVQSFQRSQRIVSSGDESTTGYGLVGPKTKAALALSGAATSNAPSASLIEALWAQVKLLQAKLAELLGQSPVAPSGGGASAAAAGGDGPSAPSVPAGGGGGGAGGGGGGTPTDSVDSTDASGSTTTTDTDPVTPPTDTTPDPTSAGGTGTTDTSSDPSPDTPSFPASDEWVNTSFASQTGSFTASFDATPSQDNGDIVVGLSSTAADTYSDLATILRFNVDGTIDVRNGGSYGADTTLVYAGGSTYHVRMVVDTSAHTYSVYVTPPGGSEKTLAVSYTFRSEQVGISSLSNRAMYGGGNGSAAVTSFTIASTPAPDRTAPAAPTSLAATVAGTSEIDLSWTAATDNVGVVSYRVFRGGSQIGTTAGTTFNNTGLSPSTTYTYTVKALDAAGNVSGNSNQVRATTDAVSAPSSPSVGSDWPDATNTGVPAGTALTKSGSMTISTAGAVISGVEVSGTIIIEANNVTLKNCKVSGPEYNNILIRPGVTGVTVQDCEIDNLGSGGQGIAGQGTFLRNNIHGAADGIDVRGDNTIIQDNYIHDMLGSSDSHFDSIQADGSFAHLTIKHNTVINENDQTSALMLDNYWGPIDDVTIENNRLLGGGYTVYISEVSGQGGPVTNVSFISNRLGRGFYGYLDLRSELGHTPTISGNVDDTTGAALNL